MKKQVLTGLGIGFTFILILGITKYFQISAAMAENANRGMPPTTVTSYIAKKEIWPITAKSIASIKAVEGSVLSAEVSGVVSKINFKSSDTVTKGAVLLELDSSVEQAELNGALAQKKLAELDFKRQETLRSKNANSQVDLDNAEAKFKSAQAEVNRLKAVLAKKKIIAPFDGKTGIRKVNLGETIATNQEIISLNQIEKLHLDFSLPQEILTDLKLGAEVKFKVDGFPEKTFRATLTAIESQVDESTRNIWLQATFENSEKLLLPGMFAEAELILDKNETVISIPTSSISYAPYGDSVYLILAGKSAEEPREIRPQTVTLGRKYGDLVSVISGVKEGEEVVSSGTFQLRPGVQVVVNNEVTPSSNTNPDPRDT